MKIKNLTKGRWKYARILRQKIKEMAVYLDEEIDTIEFVSFKYDQSTCQVVAWLYGECTIYTIEGTAMYSFHRKDIDFYWRKMYERCIYDE